MDVEVEVLTSVTQRRTLTVPAERVRQAVEQAYVDLGRQARIPGFRPGHVPRAVLVRQFEAQVHQEVAATLARECSERALADSDLRPMTAPVIEHGAFDASKAFSVTVTIEHAPTIALEDYGDLRIDATPIAIDEPEVDGLLASMVQQTRSPGSAEGPALDDAFAGRFGHGSLAELRQTVREQLLRAKERRERARSERAVVEQLSARYPFELPPTLVRQRAEALVRAIGTELLVGGLQGSAPTLEDLEDDKRADVLAEAEHSVRRELVLEAVVRREALQVTGAERDARIGLIAQQSGQPAAAVRERLGEMAGALDAAILADKAMAVLLERAKHG